MLYLRLYVGRLVPQAAAPVRTISLVYILPFGADLAAQIHRTMALRAEDLLTLLIFVSQLSGPLFQYLLRPHLWI